MGRARRERQRQRNPMLVGRAETTGRVAAAQVTRAGARSCNRGAFLCTARPGEPTSVAAAVALAQLTWGGGGSRRTGLGTDEWIRSRKWQR